MGATTFRKINSAARQIFASDIFRNTSETYGTRIILLGLGFLTSVLVARFLGPEGRGYFALAAAISGIGIQFGNLGMHSANTYYVARDRSLLPGIAGNSIYLSVIIGFVITVVLLALTQLMPQLIPVKGALLYMAIAWVPIGIAYMLLQNILIGIGDIRGYNKIELVTAVIAVSLTVALILMSQGTVETLYGAALIAASISFFWAIVRVQKAERLVPLPDLKLFLKMIRYGAKAYLAVFLGFLVLRSDLLLINYYLGAKQAGLYSIAIALVNVINIFPTVVGSIFFAKLCAIKDWNSKYVLVKNMFGIMTLIMVPVILVAFLVADFLIPLLFGKVYAHSVQPFYWLLPGALVWGIESVIRKILTSDGYRNEVLVAWFLAFILNIALNIYLIPRFGTAGAAISSSLSFLLVAAITVTTILLERRRRVVSNY